MRSDDGRFIPKIGLVRDTQSCREPGTVRRSLYVARSQEEHATLDSLTLEEREEEQSSVNLKLVSLMIRKTDDERRAVERTYATGTGTVCYTEI
jgi:hypothetical protein